MFHFFHKKYPKNETALVFTIESGEVISALVKFEGEKKPVVFYTKRESINNDAHNNLDHLTPLMLFALKKSVEDMVCNGFQNFVLDSNRFPIEKIYVFLGCPWYKSDTITKTIKRDTPFIISDDFLNKEADEFFNTLPIQGVHLDKKIISIKANGYDIDNPVGRKVQSVDLGAYISVADSSIIREIQSTVQMSFPNFEISFHTISIALYTVMNKFLETKNYIMIIPEQSVCEFMLISKGVFEASVSVPFSKHKIVDYIAREHGTSKEEAMSLLKLWRDGSLEKEKASTIETIIENAKSEWSIYVRGAMATLGRTALLPSSVYMVGKSLESSLLAEWLSVEEYANQTFTIDKFKVLFLSQKDIHPFIDSKVPHEFIGTLVGGCILFLRSL